MRLRALIDVTGLIGIVYPYDRTIISSPEALINGKQADSPLEMPDFSSKMRFALPRGPAAGMC